jgi:hypothetical protein
LLHIFPDLSFSFGIPEQIGRVIGGNNLDPAQVKDLSTKARNLAIRFKKGLGGKGPKGTDDVRPDDMDLLQEKGLTTLNFIGFRVPILRRSTFNNVGDIDLLSLEMDGLNDFGQELSCLSNKKPSLNVLVITRAFSDEH